MSTRFKEVFSRQEIDKFNRLANEWWDPQGPFKPLHIMNPVRLNYINDFVDLTGKKVLDVGCGGGLLAEGMARRGAKVTGIDMAEETLTIARHHAKAENLAVEYLANSAEQLADECPESYDLVTCLEVLEHVPQPESMVASCSKLVKSEGHVFFSTINRNIKSFMLAIVCAEYILDLLPRGTHTYRSFIRPGELFDWAENYQLQVQDSSGLLYNPIRESFKLLNDLSVNYILATKKTVIKNG